jgi:hypothetical protein
MRTASPLKNASTPDERARLILCWRFVLAVFCGLALCFLLSFHCCRCFFVPNLVDRAARYSRRRIRIGAERRRKVHKREDITTRNPAHASHGGLIAPAIQSNDTGDRAIGSEFGHNAEKLALLHFAQSPSCLRVTLILHDARLRSRLPILASRVRASGVVDSDHAPTSRVRSL